MPSLYDQKKQILKKEIEIASRELQDNISNAKVSDYFSLGVGTLPGIVKAIESKPGKALDTSKIVSKTILPRGNVIRRFISLLSTIRSIFRLIIK